MVESNLRFIADNNTPIKASFNIPYLPPHFAILDEYFVSRSYGVTTNLNGYNRETVWSIRRAMEHNHYIIGLFFVKQTVMNLLYLNPQ